MGVVVEKTSSAHNRRVRWLKYIEEKKKAEAEGMSPPPPPPSRRAGAKHKAKPLVGACTHQAGPSSSGPGENGKRRRGRGSKEVFPTLPSNLLTRKIGRGLDPPGARVRHSPLSPLIYPGS